VQRYLTLADIEKLSFPLYILIQIKRNGLIISWCEQEILDVKEVKKLAGQTLIYGLGTIVPRFLNYGILTFFYTRIFQKQEYGVVTELYAWMVLFLVVLTYGMETGFFRFAQKREDYEKVYGTALISLFISSIIFLILTNVFIGPFSSLLNYRNNHDYIRMFTAILALDAFCAIPFARLRKENRPIVFSIIKIANVIVTLLAVFFLLWWAPRMHSSGTGWFYRVYDPDYGVGYVFVANLIGSIATLIMLIPFIINIKPVFDKAIWIRMLTYSFPLMIAGLSGSINDAIDKVLLRRMIGEENGLAQVGEYGAGYKLGVLMALFIQMFRFAAEPFFFERAKHADAKETYAFVMKYFIIIMLIVFLWINLYKSGIQFILHSSYRDSMVVVPMISMAYLLYGIYVNHSIWYKLNDLTRLGIYITFTGAAITIVINVVFIPVYGYMASAWAHVLSYGAMIIMSFVMARKHYPVNYRMKEVLPYFIVAIAMVGFSVFYKYKSVFNELAINTVLFAGFIALSQYKDRLLDVLLRKERK
jgi:O-antigen/teichoic acid export membrane protein